MAISREEVEHVARLARLELTEEEKELFGEQLSVVLERAQRIQSLPLDDVPPTQHPVELSNVLRPDVVVPPPPPDRILENAPETEGPFFKVPRILEEGE
ncbi:MAG TPA: Asp-tRNA(Asn)/Glu-tRNA(Gln) amidotransferase subunit GatC [Actinomycetota bacterium]|nr:Asp-tRNA(Asn)/Glu-tRNA(Gln) amidotransferase subunit GatC [Actinomycetota bacterium]